MKEFKALGRLKKRLNANGPGIAVAVVALLIALGGAAFAAGGFTKSQEKQVKKIVAAEVKKHPGPPGPAGANGTNGAPGKDGTNGTNGKNGADGASVAVTEIQEGEEECNGLGGAMVEREEAGAQAVEVCNGKEGKQGKEGSPWTAGGVLPAGATETGTWSFTASKETKFKADVEGVETEITVGNNLALAALSFPIPLAAALGVNGCSTPATCQVHFQTDTDFSTACEGGATAPKPRPGNLCVYEGGTSAVLNATYQGIHKSATLTSMAPGTAEGANTSGAFIAFKPTAANANGNGTFAVTAPDPKVTSVSPNHGPAAGGTSVTITGSNLLAGKVEFGGVPAVGVTVVSSTEVTCTAPPHAAGAVDVTVTVNNKYKSPAVAGDLYTYE